MAGTRRLLSHLHVLYFCSLVSLGHLLCFPYCCTAKVIWIAACAGCGLPAPGLMILPMRSLKAAKAPPGAGLTLPECARVTLVQFLSILNDIYGSLCSCEISGPVCGCCLPLLSYPDPCDPLEVEQDAPY